MNEDDNSANAANDIKNNSDNVTPGADNSVQQTTAPQPGIPVGETKQTRNGRTKTAQIIINTLIIFACIGLIGGLFIFSMILAVIIGPHESCSKFGCNPTQEAVIIYGIGSLLISVPISIALYKKR